MKNKKNIKGTFPVEMLVRLLLALMIFIPLILVGCFFINRFFASSQDSKDGFEKLYDEIIEFANDNTAKEKKILLNLNDKTFIFGLNEKDDQFDLTYHWFLGKIKNHITIRLMHPTKQNIETSMIFLCEQNFETIPKNAGESALLNLKIEREENPCKIISTKQFTSENVMPFILERGVFNMNTEKSLVVVLSKDLDSKEQKISVSMELK